MLALSLRMMSTFERHLRKRRSQRKLIEVIEGPQDWAEPIPEFGLSGGQLFDARDNLSSDYL